MFLWHPVSPRVAKSLRLCFGPLEMAGKVNNSQRKSHSPAGGEVVGTFSNFFSFYILICRQIQELDCHLANKADFQVACCLAEAECAAMVCHRQTQTLVISPICLWCLMNWQATVEMAGRQPQYSNYQSRTLLDCAHISCHCCQMGWMWHRWIDMKRVLIVLFSFKSKSQWSVSAF